MGSRDTEVYIVFELYGDFAPDEVTTRLRLRPTRTFLKGDVVRTHTDLLHDESGWMVKTIPQLGDTIDPHLEWVLERLEPVASDLDALRQARRADET